MVHVKQIYKYIIIDLNNQQVFHMKIYQEILDFINNLYPESNLSIMLISRRFKENNYFKFNDLGIKKLIW